MLLEQDPKLCLILFQAILADTVGDESIGKAIGFLCLTVAAGLAAGETKE